MTFLKSYFTFTRCQRNGLLVLVALMLSLQICYYFIDFSNQEPNPTEKQQWLALEMQIDSIQKLSPAKPERYPFNPNFITDYKGYQLGMSIAQIDRLHAFREQGKFVNSALEFQQVTQISDSLLASMSGDFKFPDWVTNKQKQAFQKSNYPERPKIVVKDINSATKEDLMAVYGIGDALSDRIIKQREVLGGFVSMAQMEDIWGLSPEVVEKLKSQFNVQAVPAVSKISVNDAPINALAKFPYFRYALAKEIVTYRSMNGKIADIADLAKIKNFPVEKLEIIAVYLEF